MAEALKEGHVNDPKHNVAARDGLIRDKFRERFLLEKEIDELIEKHIQDHKDELKALKRNLKADTGIDGKDLDLLYKLFKRQEAAKLLEEEDRDRIMENLRATYEAIGGQLDFIDAISEEKDAA